MLILYRLTVFRFPVYEVFSDEIHSPVSVGTHSW